MRQLGQPEEVQQLKAQRRPEKSVLPQRFAHTSDSWLSSLHKTHRCRHKCVLDRSFGRLVMRTRRMVLVQVLLVRELVREMVPCLGKALPSEGLLEQVRPA